MCSAGKPSPRVAEQRSHQLPGGAGAGAEEELPYIEPTLVAPCKHNRWMRQRVRLAAPSTNLECLTCGAVWTTDLEQFEKCRDFYHARCALASNCPNPHIYAQGVSRIIKAGGPELTLKEFRKGVAEAKRAGVHETVDEVLEWMIPYAKRLKGTPTASALAEDASLRSHSPPADLISASGSQPAGAGFSSAGSTPRSANVCAYPVFTPYAAPPGNAAAAAAEVPQAPPQPRAPPSPSLSSSSSSAAAESVRSAGSRSGYGSQVSSGPHTIYQHDPYGSTQSYNVL